MKQFKKILLVLSVAVLVICSFMLPIVVFKQEDIQLLSSTKQREKLQSKISMQAEDIYMVKALHKIYNNKSEYIIESLKDLDIYVSNDSDLATKIEEEITNLNQSYLSQILNQETLDQEDGFYTGFEFNKDGILYYEITKEETIKGLEKPEKALNLKIEMKTNKIFYIQMKYNKDIEINKEEVLHQYVNYLGLNMIEDWRYDQEMLISQNARVKSRTYIQR